MVYEEIYFQIFREKSDAILKITLKINHKITQQKL